MKFCMVTTFYPPYNFGGDGIFVQELARDLVRDGHEVHVVHCADAYFVKGLGEPAAPRETGDGVHVHRLKSRAGVLSPLLTQQTGRPGLKAAKLRRILDQGFDVVNFHNISLVGGPGVLAYGDGLKLYTLHEHWWVCPTHILWKYTDELCVSEDCLRCCLAQRTPPQAWRSARSWMARCLEHVDLLVAPSRFTAERHRAWMRANDVDVPLEILPGYVRPFAETPPTHDVLPDRYFLYVGRLVPGKGVPALLDAMALRPEYPLVVVGEGSDARLITERRLANVRCVGRLPRERLRRFYESATALVFPSRCAETFGLTAAEALACGTPVVSTRAGGVEDVVTPDVGYLYDTTEELVGRLDALWTDRALRDRLGAAARRRHASEYTPEAYRARYYAAIARAAGRAT